MSFGGYGGSRFISTSVSDANRAMFVKAVTDLLNKYKVDGFELEYVRSPFLKRVSDPFMIIVGSIQIFNRLGVVTRSPIVMPRIYLLSLKI
jgi:hypothetical protein